MASFGRSLSGVLEVGWSVNELLNGGLSDEESLIALLTGLTLGQLLSVEAGGFKVVN